MKVKFHYIILFIFCTLQLPLFAQNADTVTSESKPKHVGILFSAEADVIQYTNNKLFGFLLNSIGSGPVYIQGYSYNKWSPGGTVPNQYSYNNYLFGFTIDAGADINPDKYKWLHNIIELGYKRVSGEYSYNVNYSEGYVSGGSGFFNVNIHDTVKSSYIHNLFCFNYKFQPTYKCFFLSLGIGFYLSSINIAQQKNERRDFSSFFEGDLHVKYDTTYNPSNNSYKVFYLNVPFQLGFGVYLKYRKLVFKPGFYIADYFNSGYLNYTFSIDIINLLE